MEMFFLFSGIMLRLCPRYAGQGRLNRAVCAARERRFAEGAVKMRQHQALGSFSWAGGIGQMPMPSPKELV
jgi:hypothetical protein